MVLCRAVSDLIAVRALAEAFLTDQALEDRIDRKSGCLLLPNAAALGDNLLDYVPVEIARLNGLRPAGFREADVAEWGDDIRGKMLDL